MNRWLALWCVLIGAGLVLVSTPPASADCQTVETVTYAADLSTVTVTLVCDPDEDSGESSNPASSAAAVNDACTELAVLLGYEINEFCHAGPEMAVVTPGLVAAALRRVPLPPSELIVQPPNGRTLVNFDTNFYTETGPLDRTIRLLGQRVDLHIIPSSYTWDFGDGATTATESAGSPYPHLEITHSYTHQGTVGPAVATTYEAQFRVNGGPWRPVPGTVTIPGSIVDLEVVEATPTLVGYH